MFFRYINTSSIFHAGHLNKALSKGPLTTTWIWNLHSDAHDFHIQQSASSMKIRRKVFSSNLAHLSLVFFWITGMHFHGAYFSNYFTCIRDPKHSLPSAQLIWQIAGQHLLNSDIGNSFQGIHITSGIFQLWRSDGLLSQIHLKYGCLASLGGTILSLYASYFHMHIESLTESFYKKFKCLSSHHLSLFFGLSSISWCGHLIHISLPLVKMLDSGIDAQVIPCPQDLLFKDSQDLLSSTNISAHHFYLGIVFITSSITAARVKLRIANQLHVGSWDAQLSMNLAIAASLSIAFAHHIYAIPIYPYCADDYPTVLCLFYHHMWVGGFLIIGAAAHASIFIIADNNSTAILNHRDVILGHLLWVSIALGLHSFSLYIHNDTLQAFGRREDIFDDNSIQLKPLFANQVQSFTYLSYDIKMLDHKVIKITQELGTADFIVHHIHAFTIHTTLLILSKGILNARNSRLVSDKFQLGFRYPCDGPGRGGTCQISPWDHISLAVFWM